jgi:hypothetical protein
MRKPMQKIAMKVRTVIATRPSHHGACVAWNTYILSCARHIWSVFQATKKLLHPFQALARDLFCLGSWCSPAMLYGLQAAYGLAGYPVDPFAVSQACFVAAQLKHAHGTTPLLTSSFDELAKGTSLDNACNKEQKNALFIQEYSISQTSLEQIFNHFAGQQEEKTEGKEQQKQDEEQGEGKGQQGRGEEGKRCVS